MWLVYNHMSSHKNEDISLEFIGESLTCDINSLMNVGITRPKPNRLTPVKRSVVISHPFKCNPIKKSVQLNRPKPTICLNRNEIRSVSIGLKKLKVINRTVNKLYYFMSTEYYENSKIIDRKFRKRANCANLTSKLTPIYEDIAY
jgi:hypothetical protein